MSRPVAISDEEKAVLAGTAEEHRVPRDGNATIVF